VITGPFGIAFDGVNIWVAGLFQLAELRPSRLLKN